MAITDRWGDLTEAERRALARAGEGRWETRFRHGGRAYRKRFPTRRDAEAFESETRAVAVSRTLTVRQALDGYVAFKETSLKPKSIENLRLHTGHVIERWGDTPLDELDRTELSAWVHDEALGASSSRQKRLMHLRAAIAWAADAGLYTGPDPTRRLVVPVTHREVQPLTIPELVKVADRARRSFTNKRAPNEMEKRGGAMWESIILWSGIVGTRAEETRSLRVGDLIRDEEGRWWATVRGTKTRASNRRVPIPESLIAYLDLDRPADRPLFEVSTGNPPTVEAMRRCLWRASEQAVGRRVHWHSLRHTAGTAAVNSTAPATAGAWLGQSGQATLLAVYSHSTRDALVTLADTLDDTLTTARKRVERGRELAEELSGSGETVEFTDEELEGDGGPTPWW